MSILSLDNDSISVILDYLNIIDFENLFDVSKIIRDMIMRVRIPTKLANAITHALICEFFRHEHNTINNTSNNASSSDIAAIIRLDDPVDLRAHYIKPSALFMHVFESSTIVNNGIIRALYAHDMLEDPRAKFSARINTLQICHCAHDDCEYHYDLNEDTLCDDQTQITSCVKKLVINNIGQLVVDRVMNFTNAEIVMYVGRFITLMSAPSAIECWANKLDVAWWLETHPKLNRMFITKNIIDTIPKIFIDMDDDDPRISQYDGCDKCIRGRDCIGVNLRKKFNEYDPDFSYMNDAVIKMMARMREIKIYCVGVDVMDKYNSYDYHEHRKSMSNEKWDSQYVGSILVCDHCGRKCLHNMRYYFEHIHNHYTNFDRVESMNIDDLPIRALHKNNGGGAQFVNTVSMKHYLGLGKLSISALPGDINERDILIEGRVKILKKILPMCHALEIIDYDYFIEDKDDNMWLPFPNNIKVLFMHGPLSTNIIRRIANSNIEQLCLTTPLSQMVVDWLNRSPALQAIHVLNMHTQPLDNDGNIFPYADGYRMTHYRGAGGYLIDVNACMRNMFMEKSDKKYHSPFMYVSGINAQIGNNSRDVIVVRSYPC